MTVIIIKVKKLPLKTKKKKILNKKRSLATKTSNYSKKKMLIYLKYIKKNF